MRRIYVPCSALTSGRCWKSSAVTKPSYGSSNVPRRPETFGERVKSVLKRLNNWRSLKVESQPISLAFKSRKGIVDDDHEVTINELVQIAPGTVKKHIAMAKNEIMFSFDNPRVFDSMLKPKHNQVDIEFDFKSEEQFKRWRISCDSAWDNGYSTSKFERTDRGTGLFSGVLDSRIIHDGKVQRAGWASIKTFDYKAFHRKNHYIHWRYYTHLLIKCRGDGRSYKVMLHMPGYIDLTWQDCLTFPLHTHGGPYWQYVKIPFSKFIITLGGRIQDVQEKWTIAKCSNLSISLMDRIDGPFKLELDYIGVVKDSVYAEKTSYEHYTLPVFNASSV